MWQLLVRLLLAGALLGTLAGARAADDPPGRVGRVAVMDGSGWMRRGGQGEWFGLQRNQPVTGGDWVSTDAGSRAMVQIGSSVLRLDGGSILQVRRLDDRHVDLWLQAGTVAVRLRQPEVIRELSISWAQGSLQPTSTGAYVVHQDDGGSRLSVLAGEARFNGSPRSFSLRAGQSVQLDPQPGSRLPDITWTDVPEDGFVAWVRDEDLRRDWAQDNPPVSPEMTGGDDLDQYGRWERHPDYGLVWQPLVVTAGWAPYRYGHWAWVAPWGWTWIDDAPWGFAPFHYGRWVYWSTRWVWVPGNYVRRPVYAPALVGWVGGPGWSVTINAGPPTVGWVPLAPREVFVPVYVYSPLYYQRVNGGYPLPPQRQPLPGAHQPVDFHNRWAPGGYTAVPTPVVQGQQPVWRAVRPHEEDERDRAPLVPVKPPPRPTLPSPGRGDGDRGGRGNPLPPSWKPVPPIPGRPGQPGQPVPQPPERKPLPVAPGQPVQPVQPHGYQPAQQPGWPGMPSNGRPLPPLPVPRSPAPPPRGGDSPEPVVPGGFNPPGHHHDPQPGGQRPIEPGPDERRRPLPVPRQPQPQPQPRPQPEAGRAEQPLPNRPPAPVYLPAPNRPPVPAAQPMPNGPPMPVRPAPAPVPRVDDRGDNRGEVHNEGRGGKAPGRPDDEGRRDAQQR